MLLDTREEDSILWKLSVVPYQEFSLQTVESIPSSLCERLIHSLSGGGGSSGWKTGGTLGPMALRSQL